MGPRPPSGPHTAAGANTSLIVAWPRVIPILKICLEDAVGACRAAAQVRSRIGAGTVEVAGDGAKVVGACSVHRSTPVSAGGTSARFSCVRVR